MSGAAVASMMDHRPTACVRNHSKDNMIAIREKERQLRMQRGMEALKMPDKAFKLKQFENVKSRAFGNKPPLPAADLVKSKEHIRLLGQPGNTPKIARRSASTPPPPLQTDEAEGENVMSMEAFEAMADQLIASHAGKSQKAAVKKDSNGCPKYLNKIKASLAKEQREAEEKRTGPAIPAGYRQMQAEEIDETVAALKTKRGNLEKEFQRLPFKIETASQKQREKRILDDIKETEESIKLFSRPMVIVEC